MADITHRVSVHVLLLRGREVLLMERIGKSSCVGTFCGPSGQVHFERVRTAGCREVQEELGVTVRPEDLIFEAVCDRTRELNGETLPVLNMFFSCTKWQGEPRRMEADKYGEPQWYGLDNLPEKLFLATGEVLANLGRPRLDEGGAL